MTTYTEAEIHTLEGSDLDTAIAVVVEGDDLTANTDERIKEAMCDSGYRFSADSRGFYVKSHGLLVSWFEWPEDKQQECDWLLEIWKRREGQPYQADLEAHVCDWRATAGPFPLEWCVMELIPMVWPDGWMKPTLRRNKGKYQFWDGAYSALPFHTEASDPATAIKRVALIVTLRKRGESNG
jgi:hypothetical protein